MVASGTGVGARSRLVHSVQGVSYFIRVVARDGHGNATTSAERPVTVPLDDASAGTYEALGGTTPVGTPFLNTLHTTSDPGAAFTLSFLGSSVGWIAPGGGLGTATVTIDGGSSEVVDVSVASGDRVVVYQKGGLNPVNPYTIVIAYQTGTIAIDALVVRQEACPAARLLPAETGVCMHGLALDEG
jgi:hypothetical protein